MTPRSSLTLAGESTSSPITMFMGMIAGSMPEGPLGALAGWREESGKMPRERNAESMAVDTCTCFFASALAKAKRTTKRAKSKVMKSA